MQINAKKHQPHLAADNLVWITCAEVGLKNMNLSVHFYFKTVYLYNVSILGVLYVGLYTRRKLTEQPVVVNPSKIGSNVNEDLFFPLVRDEQVSHLILFPVVIHSL